MFQNEIVPKFEQNNKLIYKNNKYIKNYVYDGKKWEEGIRLVRTLH